MPEEYPDVDVAIVMESTYPYLKGGVSAVVHDIVTSNSEITFGIIHITWDSKAPHEDLYGMPGNVAWVYPVYLSMDEHVDDFRRLLPSSLRMNAAQRRRLCDRIFDALEAILAGNPDPMWELYDEGMNPRTRTYSIWAVLGSQEFMVACQQRLAQIGLPFTDVFWLLREFFSLACAVLSNDVPKANVYHAHTTGYASLLGAAAARQNDTQFLLTEHNLYVRDTVNTLLDRSMELPITETDWRTMTDPTPVQRAWMTWWIEMGRFCYPSAAAITYLYPEAIIEASALAAPIEKSVIIPNGIKVSEFEEVYRAREDACREILEGDPNRTWRLVYIARVVPIKGLTHLIDSVAMLVDRGITNFHLDVLGPTDHAPDYYLHCRQKTQELHVEDYVTFRGVVNVRQQLNEFDILALPSYNEGQPIVVLEAMTAGIPTVGTTVGGMAQLIEDPLTTAGGRVWGPAGVLIGTDDIATEMADGLERVMRDRDAYRRYAINARSRVVNFFQLADAMAAYNQLYRELAHKPAAEFDRTTRPVRSTADHRS